VISAAVVYVATCMFMQVHMYYLCLFVIYVTIRMAAISGVYTTLQCNSTNTQFCALRYLIKLQMVQEVYFIS